MHTKLRSERAVKAQKSVIKLVDDSTDIIGIESQDVWDLTLSELNKTLIQIAHREPDALPFAVLIQYGRRNLDTKDIELDQASSGWVVLEQANVQALEAMLTDFNMWQPYLGPNDCGGTHELIRRITKVKM